MVRRYALWLYLGAAAQVVYAQEQKPPAHRDPQALPGPSRSTTWVRTNEDWHPGIFDCRVEKMDTSWAMENPPLEIEKSFVQFTEDGISFVDLQARNVEAYPIEALALVMEYLDKFGNVVERVPVIAATEQAMKTFHPPFLSEADTRLEMDLSPGSSVRLQSASNGIRTANCPASARITYSIVRFADSTVRTLWSPEWQLGPTPRVIPVPPEFPSDFVQPPIALLARVKISALGRVTDVIPVDQEQSHVLGLIRNQMRESWEFNPALYEGRPAASEVKVLFRIHAELSRAFPETKLVLSPVTLIEFFPNKNNPGKLLVAYGRRF